MNILCVGYRDWALEIYQQLKKNYHDGSITIIDSLDQYNDDLVREQNPDLILFYGWSWVVSQDIIDNFTCIMLHPSKLPKYRGGSPIQNQIIAGETQSAVTLFKMTHEMDAGPILYQESFSLEGHINDIFSQMITLGYKGTMTFLNKPHQGTQQIENEATYCSRRKESMSEITLNELNNESAQYLYNKIRMLEDPYPNAYFMTKDGKKLVFKSVEVSD